MAIYRQLGTIACYSCGVTVPLKENENGGLSFPCAWCDFPAYAKTGTQAAKIARERMTLVKSDQGKVDAAKEPDAPKENKSIFGM